MAQAPAPGSVKKAEQAAANQMVVTITVRGESHSVAPMNLPLQESLIFRKATGGLSVESFWSGQQAIGLDSVKMMWWLARRASGDFALTLERAWDEWPADLQPDELEVQVTEPDGADPEV